MSVMTQMSRVENRPDSSDMEEVRKEMMHETTRKHK